MILTILILISIFKYLIECFIVTEKEQKINKNAENLEFYVFSLKNIKNHLGKFDLTFCPSFLLPNANLKRLTFFGAAFEPFVGTNL